jgi:hypothetical protein
MKVHSSVRPFIIVIIALVGIIAVLFSKVAILEHAELETTDKDIVSSTPGNNDLTTEDWKNGEATLKQYFSYLSAGQYEKAAPLNGADIEPLQSFRPNVYPNDVAALLKANCDMLACLKTKSVRMLRGGEVPGEMIFVTEFVNADGTLYGQSASDGEPDAAWLTLFEFTVQKTDDGRYLVTTLPLYHP